MKEIKYQVWHKPTKTIQVVALIDFNNRVLDTYGIDEPMYDIPFEDVEWREYIGVEDKNNNPIYEGDVVKIHNLKANFKYGEPNIDWRLFKIEWNRYTWAFNNSIIYKPFSDYDTATGERYDIEIIGNIWENAELLK
jgi:uncharacterized phage protein (TIGR01671 family)